MEHKEKFIYTKHIENLISKNLGSEPHAGRGEKNIFY